MRTTSMKQHSPTTAHTKSYQPFALAKRLSALDHSPKLCPVREVVHLSTRAAMMS